MMQGWAATNSAFSKAEESPCPQHFRTIHRKTTPKLDQSKVWELFRCSRCEPQACQVCMEHGHGETEMRHPDEEQADCMHLPVNSYAYICLGELQPAGLYLGHHNAWPNIQSL